MDWLTAAEALKLLGTQPQTLYANVSRGRIKARPDPADSRKSLYRGDDVRRLAQRARGRRKVAAIAADAMHWGDPVLKTSISTVVDGRLLYRGHDAVDLTQTCGLEDVAALLWRVDAVSLSREAGEHGPAGLDTLFGELARRACTETPLFARSMAMLSEDAANVLAVMADSLIGAGSGFIHDRVAAAWGRPQAADAIRRVLVLLADHELNSSSFAARVTVSTGASLWSGALAGLATLRGPRHGLASREVAALAEDIGHTVKHAEVELRDWLGEGRYLPGMGHRLYPDGDPRCGALLAAFDMPPEFVSYLAAARLLSGDEPNVDFALAALTTRFDLPADAGISLFALGRAVGWLAHMMEQIASGEEIRPRAEYVGLPRAP